MAQIRIFADDIFRGSSQQIRGGGEKALGGIWELDYPLATGVALGLEKFRVPPPPLKYEWGHAARGLGEGRTAVQSLPESRPLAK